MPGKTYKRVIVMLADGARYDVVCEELAAGHLPNIKRYLLGDGSLIKAVTSFPSTTGPAYLPFLTGCFPGTCDVPGIRWFDKEKYGGGYSFDRYRSYVGLESFCLSRDMRPHIKTIFELVPRSYSIFNPIARGAGLRNRTRISRIWYWYYAHETDRWGFVDDAASKKLCKVLDRDPRFVFAVFPGIDEYSHLTHPRDERTIRQYKKFDDAVGDLCRRLDEKGWFDDTAIFVVSDHGLSKTDEHFCVNTFLEERGLPPFYYPLIFRKRGKLSANMVSGNGMTHVYFKNPDGWKGRTTENGIERLSQGLMEDLLRRPAVDIVAMRTADGGISVRSRRGRAAIHLDGEDLRYEAFGSDPFGYSNMPQRMSSGEVLAGTVDSSYPDAPFQLAHLMQSPRSGDLIISATPGFDLREKYEDPEHFASHGSLYEAHMRVPIISNVRFEDRPARTVDVFPTVLKILSIPVRDYVDGDVSHLQSGLETV